MKTLIKLLKTNLGFPQLAKCLTTLVVRPARGSSIMGVMVATSLTGALGLAMNQMIKEQSKSQKRLQVDFEVALLSRVTSQTLMDIDACTYSFGGVGSSSVADGQTLTSLRSRLDGIVFDTAGKYGNNKTIEIDSMTLKNYSVTAGAGGLQGGRGDLVIGFKRLSPIMETNSVIYQDFPLYFHLDASGGLVRCYSSLEDALDRVRQEMCIGMNGIYDSLLGECDIEYVYLNADKDDTMTGNLEMVDGDLSADNQICINGNCRTTFASTTCAVGQVIQRINTDGTVECSTLDCSATPATPVFRGLDAAGNPMCRAYPNGICAAGEYVTLVQKGGSVSCSPLPPKNDSCPPGTILTGLNDDGTLNCSNLNCPADKFYNGLDASGGPICRDFPEVKCADGEFVAGFDETGRVKCRPLFGLVPITGNCGGNLIAGIQRNTSGNLELECRPASYPDNNTCTLVGDRGAATGIDKSGRLICGCRPDERMPASIVGQDNPCWP